MSEIVLHHPTTEPIAAEFAPLLQRASLIVVTSKDEHLGALTIIKNLTGAERVVKDKFGDPKTKAFAAHKAICALEKELLVPLGEAKRVVNVKVTDYEREQLRLAEEERRRLEAAAKKDQEERQLEDAILAEESGNIEEAEAILAEPTIAPVIHVEPEVGKVEGVSERVTWRAEVFDKMEVIKYVARHPEWEGLLDANMPNFNRIARSAREAMQIPGVRAVSETTRAVRTA